MRCTAKTTIRSTPFGDVVCPDVPEGTKLNNIKYSADLTQCGFDCDEQPKNATEVMECCLKDEYRPAVLSRTERESLKAQARFAPVISRRETVPMEVERG